MKHAGGKESRRARSEREKVRAKKLMTDVWHADSMADSEKWVGKYAKTRVPCSCETCGNPRRFAKSTGKLTVQELRAAEEESEELAETGD